MDKDLRKRLSLTNPWHFLALGFGSGLIPFMPGTFGTIAGLPLVYFSGFYAPWVLCIVALFITIAGVAICGKTANDMQVHDHGSIVWDEIAGIAITFLWVPLTLSNLVLGFILFRVFDILKPWPIGWIDKRVSGGAGIMADDIVAGIIACACLHLVLLYQSL